MAIKVLYLWQYSGKVLDEENLALQAEEEFKKGDNAAAAKSYEKLDGRSMQSSDKTSRSTSSSPVSPNMKVAVFSVTNREDPEAAVSGRSAHFFESHKDSPLAKHTSGFGHDIYDAGRKLGEDVVGHAEDRVKKFKGDRNAVRLNLAWPTRPSPPAAPLIPQIEPFRGPDDPPLDTIRADLDAVEAPGEARTRSHRPPSPSARADLENLTGYEHPAGRERSRQPPGLTAMRRPARSSPRPRAACWNW